MTKLLLAHGADVNARTNDGKTPLSYALEKGRAEVASVLTHHGVVEWRPPNSLVCFISQRKFPRPAAVV